MAAPLQRRRMPRVLIPSDNLDFALYLAEAYRQAGWEVVMGAANFDLGGAEFDLVHFQWPEELTNWTEPSKARLSEVSTRLDEWRRRTKLVLTAHNLRPHRNGESPGFRKLYETFYQRVHVVAHFTATSRDAVTKEFPVLAQAQHIVTGYFNLDRLLPPQRDSNRARRELGLPADAFVVLNIGSLREGAEIELIKRAFDAATVPGKRLLMCGRYDEAGPTFQQRWRRWTWSRWLRSRNAVVRGYIPDPEVHRVVDAADAVLIPRFRAMNSGLPALGASFGKIIIAPRCGAYPELLANTSHPIYEPGDAASLAGALEKASGLDRTVIASECRRLVDSWQWPAIIKAIVTAAGR
jgi:glycosyltransferase involved in cell wall biosynthesis